LRFSPIKPVLPRHLLLLKCLRQDRKVNNNVFVASLFDCSIEFLELFWQCDISCFSFDWFLFNIKWLSFLIFTSLQTNSNKTSFFRFVDKRAIYRWYNLIRTCAGECDWLFHWQHKLCATFSANVNINHRLPIKVYYNICTLRHIRIKINHESQTHSDFHDLYLN
jgi:hypothetical protein